jgi:hypothetical protein
MEAPVKAVRSPTSKKKIPKRVKDGVSSLVREEKKSAVVNVATIQSMNNATNLRGKLALWSMAER